LYTDDVIYEDVSFGLIARGHAELRKMAADFFASIPISSLSRQQHVNRQPWFSEWSLVELTWDSTRREEISSVRGASVYESADGKNSLATVTTTTRPALCVRYVLPKERQ